MDIADVLEQAADLIETQGHVKGLEKRRNGYGGPVLHCAIGAIRAVVQTAVGITSACNDEPLFRSALHELAEGIGYVDEPCPCGCDIPMPSTVIAEWNDHPERKACEVIDLMKHTAKDLRNRKEAA